MNLSEFSVELLDDRKIEQQLSEENKSTLSALIILDSIDSTNSYLLLQAKNGAKTGTICLAEEQTAGRGRLGRSWYSPRGAAIYCSLLWDVAHIENVSSLSLAIAVIVLKALKKYGVEDGLQLKWPNDVWYAGRKLAGILLERVGDQIVIGIGINLYLPKEANPAWISVSEIMGCEVERNKLAGMLINELLIQLPVYQAQGMKEFLQDWHQHDILKGKAITIHSPNMELQGKSVGLSAQGELIVRDNQDQIHFFSYGEISIRSITF